MPPAIGMLVMLAAFGVGGLAVIGLLAGLLKRDRGWIRASGIALGGAVGGYGLVWVIGLLAAGSKVVPIGSEISFCDVDCDLHVAVAKASRDTDLAVTVRFRSDAKVSNGYPSSLRLAVVDDQGQRYVPASGLIAEPLAAGATIEREFRFSVPASAGHPRLQVSYDGVMDYLLPGAGNPLVQRKTVLALAETADR